LLIHFVIPQFQSLFLQFNAPLPHLTLFILKIPKLFPLVLTSLTLVLPFTLLSFKHAYKYFPNFARKTDSLLLSLPLISKLLKLSFTTKLFHTLSISYDAGLPLYDAFKQTENATKCHTFKKNLREIQFNINAGHPISKCLRIYPWINKEHTQLISSGEYSGNLSTMLQNAKIYSDMQFQQTIDTLIGLTEPAS